MCVFSPAPKPVCAAAEHLRPCLQLHVDLEPDDRLPGGHAHRSRSGTPSNPSACSSAWPARKSVFSPNCRPISCSPTGNPSERPDGTFRPGQPGQAGRDRHHVAGVHRERVGRLVADREGDRRRGRRGEDVERLERLAMLADEQRADALRLTVVGVVVARRERVGAEHDPPLRLVAEAGVTRPLDHLAVRRCVDARAVADAVVAGEVGRGLGRRDQVVARHPVVEGERQVALADLGPERPSRLDRRLERRAHAGLDRRPGPRSGAGSRCAGRRAPPTPGARPAPGARRWSSRSGRARR